MRPTPYVASLRVYEPITAFIESDQLRWNQIPVTTPTGRDEQHRALWRVIASEPPALKLDGAHILEIDDKKYIAPWSTAARCWTALDDFKSSMPFAVSSFFLPKEIENALSLNSESIEDKVSHIITATWSIPPRWFALFEPSDRIRGTNDDGAYTILRTSISMLSRDVYLPIKQW